MKYANWIKFAHDTPDKPEIWEIAAILKIDPDAVIGKLIRTWIWFDQHTLDGNAKNVTDVTQMYQINRLVVTPGFCEAVIQAGWMVRKDGKLTLPNFDRHNGETAKKRALTSKRVKKLREKKRNDSGVTKALPDKDKDKDIKKKVEPNGSTGDISPEMPPSTTKKNVVPFQKIVALYHEILPNAPKVEKLTKARQGYIRQRWLSDLETLDGWRNYFLYVAKSKFLTGKTQGRDDKPPFVANLEWLTKESNYAKVAEGNYHKT
mgnify:CR=1 FL=1